MLRGLPASYRPYVNVDSTSVLILTIWRAAVENDVVPITCSRPETIGAARLDTSVGDDLVEDCVRVVEQFLRTLEDVTILLRVLGERRSNDRKPIVNLGAAA